ncbi:MAG: hypothetical protein ABW352_10315 [Polyangiales bacterium]
MATRFLLIGFLLFSFNTARAAAPQLRWSAPAECPDRASVHAAIARTRPDDVDLGTLAVSAEVTHASAGYRLALTLETPSAKTHRTLIAERCGTFVELVALEVAMVSTAQAHPPAAPTLAWGARAVGGLGTGPGPGLAPRVGLLGILQRERWRVELGASYDLPRVERYPAQREVGARLQGVVSQLRGCHVLPLASLELPLCVGLEAGAWRGEGRGVDSPGAATRPWLAAGASAGLRYPRQAPIALFVGVEGLGALLRPSFGFRNLPTLYRPARLAVRGTLGVELHFD